MTLTLCEGWMVGEDGEEVGSPKYCVQMDNGSCRLAVGEIVGLDGMHASDVTWHICCTRKPVH